MDKWFCFCSKTGGEDDTIVRDNADISSRPRSIFNLFKRKKSSKLSEDVRETEGTRLLKDSTNSSSESYQSVKITDHEENMETDHASDPEHEQTDYAYSGASEETTENETQVRNTRHNVEDKCEMAQIYTTVKCNELKTEQFERNPVLFDVSHLLYVVENTESLRSPCEDMELINFSNINTKSLMSSFQHSATPNVGYRYRYIPLEYCRNVASCLKLEDEYVNVQIFARLPIESFTESSSDESASAPKRSQCPPTKGPAKKKKKKKKAPNVSNETGAVGAVPVVKTVQQLAGSKQIEHKGQPFLQAINTQLKKGLDSAKTSASRHVLPTETETVQPTIDKLVPACQTSKAKNSNPSTSAVQKTSFECKSLEKVVGKGFLINETVQISNRNWNCITRTDGVYYCELCKTAAINDKSKVIVHMASSSHHSLLQEWPILVEFGNSLIRKVNTGLNHCAICNVTLVETYTAEHCRGGAHTELYTLACQSASLIVSNKFKRYRLENFNVITVDKSNIGMRTSNASNTVKAASSVLNAPKKTVNSTNSVPSEANKAAISVINVPKKTANSVNSVPNAANKKANSVPNVPKKTANLANSVPNTANTAANSVPNVANKKTANSANSVSNAANKAANSVPNVANKKTANSVNSVPNAANKKANSVPNVPKKTANSANKAANSVPNVPKKTANSANSVPNAANKAANSVPNVPKKNSATNVATKASASPKVFKIEDIRKVAGEDIMVNQTVIVSRRSWSTFTGTNTKRYCNVCLTDANGPNGFVHMNDPKHINTLKEYSILEDYELNLIRKLPNKQFFCTICSIVTKNVPEHLKTAQHRENYSGSLNRMAKILLI